MHTMALARTQLLSFIFYLPTLKILSRVAFGQNYQASSIPLVILSSKSKFYHIFRSTFHKPAVIKHNMIDPGAWNCLVASLELQVWGSVAYGKVPLCARPLGKM